MMPIDQARLHDPESGVIGDCARAAVASLLECSLEDVVDFTAGVLADESNPSAFWKRFAEFFESRGLIAYRVSGNLGLDCVHLASGRSPRGVSHMVVRKGFEVIHDPHPSRAGLVDITHITLILPIDVSQWHQVVS